MAFNIQPQRHQRGASKRTVTLSTNPVPAVAQAQSESANGSQQWIIFGGASDAERSPTLNSELVSRPSAELHACQPAFLDTGSWRVVSDEHLSSTIPDTEWLAQPPSAEPRSRGHSHVDESELDSLNRHHLDPAPELLDLGAPCPSPPAEQSTTFMPAHDGLGTFAPSSIPVQRQIYGYERFNPGRAWRTPVTVTSLGKQHAQDLERTKTEVRGTWNAVLDLTAGIDEHRRRRIEQWTLESSKIVMEEVARESRRRQAPLSTHQRRAGDRPLGWISKQRASSIAASSMIDEPSFWDNLHTRIQDFFGLDNEVLAAIFGEALISQSTQVEGTIGEESEERAHHRVEAELQRLLDEPAWKGNNDVQEDPDVRWAKLCERVDHEMNILARHLRGTPADESEQHPSFGHLSNGSQLTIKTATRLGKHLSLTDRSAQQSPIGYQYSEQPQSAYIDEDPDLSRVALRQQQQEVLDEAHWSRRLDFTSTFRYLKDQLSASLPNIPGLSSSPVDSLDDLSDGLATPVNERWESRKGRAARLDGWNAVDEERFDT